MHEAVDDMVDASLVVVTVKATDTPDVTVSRARRRRLVRSSAVTAVMVTAEALISGRLAASAFLKDVACAVPKEVVE